jgi:hypothetical protein
MNDKKFEHIINKMCKDKTYYEREGLAQKAVRKLTNKGLYFRCYLCPFCGLYHITSKSKAELEGNHHANSN